MCASCRSTPIEQFIRNRLAEQHDKRIESDKAKNLQIEAEKVRLKSENESLQNDLRAKEEQNQD